MQTFLLCLVAELGQLHYHVLLKGEPLELLKEDDGDKGEQNRMDDPSTTGHGKSGHDRVTPQPLARTTTNHTPPQTKRQYGSCRVQSLDQNENAMP